MIVQYAPASCWRHVWPSTGHDGEQHFDTAQEALARRRDDEEQPSAAQFDEPCWLIRCDGCGADPDGDDFDHIHWPTPDVARDAADTYDYVIVGDKVWCEDCKADLNRDDRPQGDTPS